MIHAIVQSDLPPIEKSCERILEEVSTVAGAGYESTAQALRLILYHIYSNEEILRRLREELASVSNASSLPIELRILEQQSYLTAVIKEGIRLSPAIATRASRVTDNDLVYNKWRIPAGTPTGMTTILLHTDETSYSDPLRFNPNRWLETTSHPPASFVYAPFSKGSRVCLGMQ